MLSKHFLWRFLRTSRHAPVSYCVRRTSRHAPVSYCVRSNILKVPVSQCKTVTRKSDKEDRQDRENFIDRTGTEHAKFRTCSDGTSESISQGKMFKSNGKWLIRHLGNQLEIDELLPSDTHARIANYEKAKLYDSVQNNLLTCSILTAPNRSFPIVKHIVRQYHTENIGNKVNEDENAREIEDLTETENETSIVNISVSETRLPEEFEYQETSVWEEIMREKEKLELGIPESVEVENPIFPALPIIKPQGDITSEETEITEYDPDRQRKVAFPTKIHNLAPLVNHSETLKQLVKLGVDLSVVEKTSVADKIIKMNFKKDVKPYLIFLHQLGITPEKFGRLLTKTPYLFQEDIETLKARINYFKSKKFKREEVAGMVVKNAKFLLMSTERIDAKLGFFQRCFKLKGSEVRQVAIQSPKTLIIHEDMIKSNKFRLSEYLGFTDLELKKMVLTYPKIFHKAPFQKVEDVFNVLHHKMDIPHSLMVVWPKILEAQTLDLEQRHRFLLKVNRAQYDPTKENYVSLKQLVATKDEEFCIEIAQASLLEYYNFLKTI